MTQIFRAQGCLLGQLVGDALGSLVEFQKPSDIRMLYPDGVRDLEDGGTWDTIAGQPTDDSEMALSLARVLVFERTYNPESAFRAYRAWLDSGPFDCGTTIRMGLTGTPNLASQSNGALMRISPLGIFGARRELHQVGFWSRSDAALTHPNPICLDANQIYAMAISFAIASGPTPQELHDRARSWVKDLAVAPEVSTCLTAAGTSPPKDYLSSQGWVLVALGNAFWQLLYAKTAEDAIIDTVMRGGDTDTNAAICGALVGAVFGIDQLPKRWIDTVRNCMPAHGLPNVRRPRPPEYWPNDAHELAGRLLV